MHNLTAFLPIRLRRDCGLHVNLDERVDPFEVAVDAVKCGDFDVAELYRKYALLASGRRTQGRAGARAEAPEARPDRAPCPDPVALRQCGNARGCRGCRALGARRLGPQAAAPGEGDAGARAVHGVRALDAGPPHADWRRCRAGPGKHGHRLDEPRRLHLRFCGRDRPRWRARLLSALHEVPDGGRAQAHSPRGQPGAGPLPGDAASERAGEATGGRVSVPDENSPIAPK